jgi:hypothetical protein
MVDLEEARRNNNQALTFAIDELAENWRAYRQRYELWLKK